MYSNISHFKRKTMPTKTNTPQTNHTASQLDSPQPHSTHGRMHKKPLNIIDELRKLQKRTNNEAKRPESSSTVSADEQTNSFKQILRQKQMKNHLDHHYKQLQRYHDALPQYNQQELQYSTLRIMQQNQKQKVQQLKQKVQQLKQKYQISISTPTTSQFIPVQPSKQQKSKGKK